MDLLKPTLKNSALQKPCCHKHEALVFFSFRQSCLRYQLNLYIAFVQKVPKCKKKKSIDVIWNSIYTEWEKSLFTGAVSICSPKLNERRDFYILCKLVVLKLCTRWLYIQCASESYRDGYYLKKRKNSAIYFYKKTGHVYCWHVCVGASIIELPSNCYCYCGQRL